MLTVRSIFLYLDRTYVISTTGVKSLFEMGLHLFRLHLATHPEVTSCSTVTEVISDELAASTVQPAVGCGLLRAKPPLLQSVCRLMIALTE